MRAITPLDSISQMSKSALPAPLRSWDAALSGVVRCDKEIKFLNGNLICPLPRAAYYAGGTPTPAISRAASSTISLESTASRQPLSPPCRAVVASASSQNDTVSPTVTVWFQESTMPVQKMRLQRGWSQQQLAELSGLSTRTIQRIERGEPPSVESLKALASVFEVDFSELRETNMNATPTNPSDIEEALAFKHVRKLRGFYIHLIQYVVVVGALTVFNLWRTPDRLWFGWVAAGWGIGLLFHALRVFNRGPFLGAKWETEQVEKYLGRKL